MHPEPNVFQAQSAPQLRLPALMAGLAVALAIDTAQAANPLSITFTSAAQKNAGGTVVWLVPAPAGANMVIKASPGVLAQTKTVTMTWKGFEGSDQVWAKPPPGPASVQLDASGQATAPIKFAADSYKQWQITACVNWQPPNYGHKIDDCVVSYMEGENNLAKKSESLILIVSPEHPAPTHNWQKIPKQGNYLGVAVQEDLVAKSPDKLVRLKYESSNLNSDNKTTWPAPTGSMTPKTMSLSGVASQGGWVKKSESLIPDPQVGEWLTIRACMTIDYSGEVCSANYAYRLTGSATAKMSDQPKDHKVDSNQPLPPVSPPPSGGGGGGGGTGNKNLMAPPRMLGAPATGVAAPAAPARQGPAPAPTLSPTAPAPADAGRMAPAAAVPGCSPIAAAPGQHACASRDAYAGCERQRAADAPGIRGCTLAGDGRRR